MKNLLQAIADLAMEIHPETMDGIADVVAKSTGSKASHKIGLCGLHGTSASFLKKVLAEWNRVDTLEPGEMAAALRSAAAVASIAASRQSFELAWSGPDTGLVPLRRTEQVLIDIIDGATDRFFMVSFVAFAVPSVTRALKAAISRGVRVEVLLESALAKGGTLKVDSVALIMKVVPEAVVYIWKPEGRTIYGKGHTGSVHAKCVVADGRVAFVTSANLTEAAMEGNMEMGILVRGGDLPQQLERHLRALVTTREISGA